MNNSSSKQTRRSFVELSTIGLVGTVVVGCSEPPDAAGETGTGGTSGNDEDSSSSDDTKSASDSSETSGDDSTDESSNSSGESSESSSSSDGSSGDSSSEESSESESTESESTESGSTESESTESGSTESESTESESTESTESSGTESGSTESGSTESESTESTEDDGSDTDSVCEEIDPLTEGPFYQRLAERMNGNLDVYGDDGVKFELVGRVLDLDCKPIANAAVGMWHSSPSKRGETSASNQSRDATYDHPADQADSNPSENKYYGRVQADADGRYRFTSLRPGWYRNGNYYRPSHLHIKVFMGNRQLLTTQLFFDDDPELMNDGKNGQGHLFNAKNVLSVDAMGKAEFDLIVDV